MNWSKEYLEARMLDAIEGRLSEEQLIQLKQFIPIIEKAFFIHYNRKGENVYCENGGTIVRKGRKNLRTIVENRW